MQVAISSLPIRNNFWRLSDETPQIKSVFDIMGPVMIGPSSSHTAGAVRIGKLYTRFSVTNRPKSSFISISPSQNSTVGMERI
jgi:iron-sulfur-dependent L-serine dehydratase beta subunit